MNRYKATCGTQYVFLYSEDPSSAQQAAVGYFFALNPHDVAVVLVDEAGVPITTEPAEE